jgi:integrase
MAGNFIQRSRHGTVFYFRRRVPVDLRPRIGRLHLYASLRTELLAEAKRRARALAAATDRLFTELRYMQGDDKDKLVQTDYGLTLDFDDLGQPRVNLTDLKPGDESSAEDLAKRLLGVAKPANLATDTPATPTVAEAMEAVLADPGIKRSTAKEYRRAFVLFSEFVGSDTRLGDIRAERFSAFADHVRARPDWAAKTQSFFITTAQRLFSYYESRNSAVPKISTKGLKPKRTAPAGHDRGAYSLADLEVLIRNVAQYRIAEPAKWWVTVIPIFTGVRIEELAQAHLDGDFLIDEGSRIHYLQIDELIRGTTEAALASPKSVKSKAGWRKVPIHPALVEAGLLDYLDGQRRAGFVTPFASTWKPLNAGRVKHSHKITDWGGDELRSLREARRITTEKVTYFHSMRHSFTTLLAKAGIEEEWRAAITGHQFGGMNAQVYNKAKNDVTITLPKIEQGVAPLVEIFSSVLKNN